MNWIVQLEARDEKLDRVGEIFTAVICNTDDSKLASACARLVFRFYLDTREDRPDADICFLDCIGAPVLSISPNCNVQEKQRF